MMCRVGSVVAPFCVYLRSVWIFMPLVSIYFKGFEKAYVSLIFSGNKSQTFCLKRKLNEPFLF